MTNERTSPETTVVSGASLSLKQRSKPATESPMYREALIAAREYSTDALLALADGFAATVADTDAEFPGEVGRLIALDRLRAVRTELTRRDRLSRINRDVASPSDRTYEAWRTLAGLVRDRIDMLHLFDLCGYHFIHKDGAKEAHAACPLCGGTDRLVITAGPPDLCWCRQCQWGGDVITVAMSFHQFPFHDAVSWLAHMCGEQTPSMKVAAT